MRNVLSQPGSIVVALFAFGIAAFASSYLWLDVAEFSFDRQREVYAVHLTALRLHVTGGVIALVLGAAQLFAASRRRIALHRWLGRTYVVAVVVSAFAGFEVARYAFAGASNTAAFWMLSALWLYTTGCALWHIRQRDVAAHQRWIIRSYALTFAAVTLRAQLGLLQLVPNMTFTESYLIVPWLCWITNLLFVEWFVLPRLNQKQAAPTAADVP